MTTPPSQTAALLQRPTIAAALTATRSRGATPATRMNAGGIVTSRNVEVFKIYFYLICIDTHHLHKTHKACFSISGI